MALTEAGRERIRAAQKARWERYKESVKTCSKGHPWTPENTRYGSSPSRSTGVSGRVCRQCERDHSKERYYEAKARGVRMGGKRKR